MTQSERGQAESCPVCGTDDIDESIESFEGACENCGFVIREDRNSHSLDWEIGENTFRQPEEEEEWLSTCRVRNSTEQQLAEAFNDLENFINQIGLQDEIRESAVELYCDAFRAGLTDGRKTTCVVAACLRLASRQVEKPIPKSRLTECSGVDETKFHSSNHALCDELDVDPCLPTAKEYIPFLQTQLELADDVWEATERVLTIVEGHQSMVGKDPAGIAAGAVYLSQEENTQWDVAKAVGLSTETVRQRIKQLREVVDGD
jgi:transcription initiation factor TFIIB